jgi:GT2 family glycosyltransferase
MREEMVSIGPGLFPKDQRTNDFMHWLENSGELFGVSFTDPAFQLPPYYFYMANTSLKLSFLQRAGPFDEDFPYDAMDDWEMGKRLVACGMRNHYLPDAVATHEHIISLEERCRAMRQAGESSAIYDAKNSQPGPWAASILNSKIPYSSRKRESRQQRYKRIVSSHWRKGYENSVKKQAVQRQQAERTKS